MPKLTLEDLISSYPEEIEKIIQSRKNSSFLDEDDFIKKQLQSKSLLDELAQGASEPAKYKKQLQNLSPEVSANFAKSRQTKVDDIIKNYELDQLLNKDRSQIAKDLVEDFNRFGEGSPDPQAELEKQLAKEQVNRKASIFDSPAQKLERELSRREIARGAKGYIDPNSPVIRSMNTPEATKQFQSEMGVKEYTPPTFRSNEVGQYTAMGGPRKYSWPPAEILGEGQSSSSMRTEDPLDAEFREIKPEQKVIEEPTVSPETAGAAGAAAGASRFSELLKNPKVAAMFGIGKNIIAPGAALYEAEKAREELTEGNYKQGGLHGLAGLGAASVAVPNPLSPLLIPAGAIAGIEANFPQVSQGIADAIYKALPESMKPQVDKPEVSPTPTPAPGRNALDELKTIYEKQLDSYPDYKPSEEPSPTPSKPDEVSSTFGNKVMDILGMPSAAAAEMSQRVPASIEEKQAKKVIPDAQDIQNLVYIRAKENNFPPVLALAFAEKESGFNVSAPKNKQGAGGIMQITPIAFKDVKMHTKADYLKNMKHQDLMNPRNYDANLRTGLDLLKLTQTRKGLPDNFDYLNRDNVLELVKGFFGSGADEQGRTAEDYTNELMPLVEKYDKTVKPYEQTISTPIKREENEVPVPDWLNKVLDVNKKILGGDFNSFVRNYDKLKEAGVVPSIVSQTEYDQNKQDGGLVYLPFNKQNAFGSAGSQTISPDASEESTDDAAKKMLADIESGEGSEKNDLESLDLVKALQDESANEKMMNLMTMQNLLRSQSMTPFLKGMQLAASGIVGAGPKKPFITVPKLEGAETFADLERAPASMLLMQKQMKEDKFEDPTSNVSKAYRKYASETLKRLDDKFDASKLEGLSANSIKTLLPMGLKEESLFLKKLKDEASKGEVSKRMDDAFTNRQLKPLADELSGKSGLFKDIENQKKAATNLLTSTLGMPQDITLSEFLKNKRKWEKIWDGPTAKGGVDDKRAKDTVQALNTLLSGKGAPTKSLFDALSPKTLESYTAAAQSFAEGKPISGGYGQYMALFAEMALRSKSVFETTKRDLAGPKIKSISKALDQRPDYSASKAYFDELKTEHSFSDPQDEENIRQLMQDPSFHGDYFSAKKAYDNYKNKLK